MEEEKTLTFGEQFRWILSALFFLCGAIYCSIGFSLAGLVVSVFVCYLEAVCYLETEENTPKNLYSDVFLCNSIIIASLGLTSTYWFGVAVVVVYVLFLLWIYKGKIRSLWLNLLMGASFSLIIFPLTSDNPHGFRKSHYTEVRSKYEYCQRRVNSLNFLTNEERQKVENPYKIFVVDNVLDSAIRRQSKDFEIIVQKTDSISTLFNAQKRADFQKIRNQYRGKVDTLRVKRFWMNSASLPWTWQAYTSIQMRVNSSFLRNNASLEIEGKASYKGEAKFDYVNVVFSDNSYQRFNIKDNPQWILIRDLDKVERRYVEKTVPEGEALLNSLNQKDFDLVFDKKYIPLLKK